MSNSLGLAWNLLKRKSRWNSVSVIILGYDLFIPFYFQESNFPVFLILIGYFYVAILSSCCDGEQSSYLKPGFTLRPKA